MLLVRCTCASTTPGLARLNAPGARVCTRTSPPCGPPPGPPRRPPRGESGWFGAPRCTTSQEPFGFCGVASSITVLEVEVRGVDAVAAVDRVLLTVADADVVVAVLAADRVAGHVVRPVTSRRASANSVVVAGAADRRVLPAVGEDAVVARTAVLRVGADAAGHHVVAAVAGRVVLTPGRRGCGREPSPPRSVSLPRPPNRRSGLSMSPTCGTSPMSVSSPRLP